MGVGLRLGGSSGLSVVGLWWRLVVVRRIQMLVLRIGDRVVAIAAMNWGHPKGNTKGLGKVVVGMRRLVWMVWSCWRRMCVVGMNIGRCTKHR